MITPSQIGATRIYFLKKAKSIVLAGLAIGGLAMTMSPAHAYMVGDTAIWDFNLPATGLSSITPPYPSVATLTLEQTLSGVRFTLDPNESNPGFSNANNETVNRLDIVYTGVDLLSTAFSAVSGPEADPNSFSNQQGVQGPFVAVVPPPGSASTMDSSYYSSTGQLLLNWPTSGSNEFTVDQVSVWDIAGVTLDNFLGIMATTNNKPSPTYGIISVDAIDLKDTYPELGTPTPSNWVTGVPVPAAVWLFGSGLLGMIGVGRRRKAG